MRPLILLAMTLGVVACDDSMITPSQFPEDEQACKEAMAFRERTTPDTIEVIGATALRDGSGVQVTVTHFSQNMTLCRTNAAHRVVSLEAY